MTQTQMFWALVVVLGGFLVAVVCLVVKAERSQGPQAGRWPSIMAICLILVAAIFYLTPRLIPSENGAGPVTGEHPEGSL